MDSATIAQAQRAFGRRVRAERVRHGLSQEALASASGLGPGFISNLELGHRRPSFSAIIALASSLGVLPSDLFHDVEAPIKSQYSPDIVRIDGLLKEASTEAQQAVLQAARIIVGRYKIPRRRRTRH